MPSALLAVLAGVVTAGCQHAPSVDSGCRHGDGLHQPAACSFKPTAAQRAALANVVAELNPGLSISNQTWSGVNCLGRVGPASRVAPNGLPGRLEPGNRALRFGIESAHEAGRQSFVFRVLTEDTAFADGRRCEALAYPQPPTALPVGIALWYAVTLRVDAATAQARGAALLTQWHTQGYNPFLGLYLVDGHLRITLRHDPPRVGDRPAQLDAWTDAAAVSSDWTTFVFRAELRDPRHKAGTLQVWRDSRQLVDYAGPLGYASVAPGYVKLGYYHWNNHNPWDDRVPVRTVHVQGAALVPDPAGVLNEHLVRMWLDRRTAPGADPALRVQ